MDKPQTVKHPRRLLTLAISKSFERATYYGVRTLLVLYLTGEIINMPSREALVVYGWFSILVLMTGIIGALIGDLAIGKRKAIIYGAIIQFIGLFTLCIPNKMGLYTGLTLFLIGNGLFTPNFTSNFGKQYLNKTKLLDSGFMVLFLGINIGALAGPMIFGYTGETSFTYGFIGAGISILISLIFFLLSKSEIDLSQFEVKNLGKKNLKTILIALTAIGIYWALYEISFFSIIEIQRKVVSTLGMNNIPRSILSSSTLFLPIGIITAIVWSKHYSSQFTKLTIGLISTAISFGLLLLIPETLSENHVLIYFLSIAFLGLGEVFLAPVLLSVLTQYSNPKYLTILISLASVPTRVFGGLLGIFNTKFFEQPKLGLTIAFWYYLHYRLGNCVLKKAIYLPICT